MEKEKYYNPNIEVDELKYSDDNKLKIVGPDGVERVYVGLNVDKVFRGKFPNEPNTWTLNNQGEPIDREGSISYNGAEIYNMGAQAHKNCLIIELRTHDRGTRDNPYYFPGAKLYGETSIEHAVLIPDIEHPNTDALTLSGVGTIVQILDYDYPTYEDYYRCRLTINLQEYIGYVERESITGLIYK